MATGERVAIYHESMFLSTPPSRVATEMSYTYKDNTDVSIHATLAGGDRKEFNAGRIYCEFLSTPPSRVATIQGNRSAFHTEVFLSTPPSRVATERQRQFQLVL